MVINVAAIIDQLCADLGNYQRSNRPMPSIIQISHETYKAIMLSQRPELEPLTMPKTFFGRAIEFNERLAPGAYELK